MRASKKNAEKIPEPIKDVLHEPRGGSRGTIPIADYAIVGNCHTAALISTRGAIEWMCLPRFDDPSVFAAILDPERGGRLQVCPSAESFEATRRYVPGTPVLENHFKTERGAIRLTDFMPAGPATSSAGAAPAPPALCRLITGLYGKVRIRLTCDPRPGYAAGEPISSCEEGIYAWKLGDQHVRVRSDIPLACPVDGQTLLEGETEVSEGQRFWLVVEDAAAPFAQASSRTLDALLERTIAWWREWISQLSYTGPYQSHVERSAITLKLMCHAPTGAVVAAPTTSLPEKLGGRKNWDYRYCWVRDASMSVRALLEFGLGEEAKAFLSWLVTAPTRFTPRLHVLYDVDGHPDIPEYTLDHLSGYAGSRPVRAGNAASGQLQLDCYGAMIDAVFRLFSEGGDISDQTADFLRALGEQVCELWRRPDNGIWESRLGLRHHTLSKAMCWVALDRLIMLHDHGRLDIPREKFDCHRRLIRRAVERRGVDAAGHYIVTFGDDAVDPSLLLLALYGYEPASSERMSRTLDQIDRTLGPIPLINRHLAGHENPHDECAFAIAGFWAVEVMAGAGMVDRAHRTFEQLLEYANDLGLYGEEIDRENGSACGNFPQAFSHIGLLNAARALARAGGDEKPGEAHDRRVESASV